MDQTNNTFVYQIPCLFVCLFVYRQDSLFYYSYFLNLPISWKFSFCQTRSFHYKTEMGVKFDPFEFQNKINWYVCGGIWNTSILRNLQFSKSTVWFITATLQIKYIWRNSKHAKNYVLGKRMKKMQTLEKSMHMYSYSFKLLGACL